MFIFFYFEIRVLRKIYNIIIFEVDAALLNNTFSETVCLVLKLYLLLMEHIAMQAYAGVEAWLHTF